MSEVYPHISLDLAQWIHQQKNFFVATAPLSKEGHINCSPKGSDTFRILNEMTVAYLDLTGSGVETIAHLKENGRIVIMFCAFEGPPRIARLYGKGEVVEIQHPEYPSLINHFSQNSGQRAIIKIAVERVSTSCGMAVPLFEFKRDREDLDRWAQAKGPEKLKEYRERKNKVSIDELRGL